MKKVKGFITRKSLMYKTNVEYGDYTINHVFGCMHGCRYPCYAYMMAKRFGKVKTYEEWKNPYLVENALVLLDIEIPKYRDKIKMLHLCFTTDAFMYGYQEIEDMSMEIIKRCNNHGISCSVLTKGILPRGLAELSKSNEYGITLVSLDEGFRHDMEPNTALLTDRINGLQALHDVGCKTWVSIEPYPTPNIINQNLSDVLDSISFVDKIIFGRMNYNPEVAKFPSYREFFNEMSRTVIEFCDDRGISYLIKKGTRTEED